MTADLTIGEVSRRTGLSVHTLRFYEREGIFANPVRRSNDGRRRYDEDDIGWLTVCTILRESGMPIPEIRHYTELVRAGDGNESQRLELLLAQRVRVREQEVALAKCRDLIEFKIGVYQDIVDSTGNAKANENAS